MDIKFIKLIFANIMSFGGTKQEINFEHGLALINGQNGVGKSTIYEALCFCLFGKPYRDIKMSELINRKNKKNLYTEVEFVKNQQDTYKIIRSLKPNSVQIFKNNVEIDTLSSKKLNQDEIDKIIGIDYSLFKQIISLAVVYNKPFIALSTPDKRKIIEQVFNISIFGEMLKINKKKISLIKPQIEMNERTSNILESNIDSMKSRYLQIETAKKNFDNDKKQNVIKIKNNLQDKKNSLSEILNDISKLTKDKDLICETEFVSLENYKKERDRLNRDLTELQYDIKLNKNILEKNNKEEIEKEILEYKNDLERYKKEKDGIEINKNIENHDKEINKLTKQITELEYENKIYKTKIDEMDKMSVCSKCNTVVTEEHKQKEISEFNKIINENEIKIVNLKNELKDIKDDKDKLNRYLQLENNINELEKEIIKLESKIKQIDDCEKMIEHNQGNINNINERLKFINDLIKQNEVNLEKYNQLKQKIEMLEYSKKSNERDISDLEIRLKDEENSKFSVDIKSMKRELLSKHDELKNVEKEGLELNEKKNVYDISSEILSDEGIKSYFFKNLVPILNEKINSYLRLFEIQINIKFDEYMNEKISNFANMSNETSYYSYSEGEKKRIDISILLSFIDITKMLSDWNCNLLIIDELLDGAIDDNGLEQLVMSLKQMVERDNDLCIYVISHRLKHNYEDLFNKIIQIKKQSNKFSKIV